MAKTIQKPNILFIFSDQQHWQALGCTDSSFQTPNLDRLAREATMFSHAFCTTPQCSPSRSSIMTGLYPSKTGVFGNIGAAGGRPLRIPTIAPLLRDAGYRTAYFGKWHLGKDPVGTAGWDEDFGVTGHETTDDAEVTRRALLFLEKVAETGKTDCRTGEVAGDAGTSIGREAASGVKPFALFLSYNNPHDIYHFGREEAPAPKNPIKLPPSWELKDLSAVPRVHKQFMEEDQGRVIAYAESPAWERYREIYREKVRLYDNELGRVMDALEGHGLGRDTLVVITSDHGDMDTHHRLIYKGPFMYEHMMRVPLLFRLPNGLPELSKGRVCDFPTVNVDLVPTLKDFAGCAQGALIEESDGFSLKPLLSGAGDVPHREFIIGQYYSKQKWVNPIRMICNDSYKYNLYRLHGEELYDLENDPMELFNLDEDEDYVDLKRGLAARLHDWMSAVNDPFYDQYPTTRDGVPLTQGLEGGCSKANDE